MDPKALYWALAVVNFGALTVIAITGVRQAQHGELARHRRSMITAAVLVGVFLVSYVLKINFLGREALGTWPARDVWILRFHELCVLAMILGGGVAFFRSRALRRSRRFTFDASDPQPESRDLNQHRLAGRIAVGGAVFGVLSAALVWLGMWSRLS